MQLSILVHHRNASSTLHLVYTLYEPCPVTTPISSPISSPEYHEIAISIQASMWNLVKCFCEVQKYYVNTVTRINTSCNSVKKFQ